MSNTLTLTVDDETIILDESFMDFTDFTYRIGSHRWSSENGWSSTVSPPRERLLSCSPSNWPAGGTGTTDQAHAVFALLTAWLTDNLVEV